MKKDSHDIAVIRTGAIGDSLVLFPLLTALRATYPDSRILALGRRDAFAIAEEDGTCSRALSPDALGLWTLYSDSVEPDGRVGPNFANVRTVLDFDGVKLADGRAEFLGVGDWRVLPPLPPERFGGSAASFYLQNAGFVGASDWVWQPRERATASPRAMLAIAPGAGSIRKRASAEWFVAVARAAKRRGISVAVVNGEADRNAMDEYVGLGGPMDARFEDLPLTELRARLSRCAYFVGNDSGISHLAAYTGIPTAIRFVSSNPTIWAPRSPNVLVVNPNTQVAHSDLWERLELTPSIRRL